ncbi:fungal-specific transcription factor domain-containing protein [Aspergillus ambiguus]|uniref:Zn(II)2Cys6 transcription factor n=1 Tax=Aspergillus ambiguus TaxID=176160 RepID=UPI003CCCBF13
MQYRGTRMDEHPMIEACYTCRRRRIQCDRSQVPCRKCTASGLECYDKRPIRWVRGVAIRGKMQGISFRESSGPTEAPKGMIPSAIEEFPRRLSEDHLKTGIPGADGNLTSPRNIPLALEEPIWSSLDATSQHYLDYYNQRICKLFIVYDSAKNPFRGLISLALADETLCKAAIALAARHKANSDRSFDSFHEPGAVVPAQSRSSHYDALLFKQQAMHMLARDLQDTASCAKDTIMASIFLLIFLDLLESGSDRWNVHLEGVKRLIEMNPLLSGSAINPSQDPGATILHLRSFITRQIYLIETLGATFVRPKLLTHFNFLEQSEALQQETVEQSFLGCPEYLLTAIQSLSTYRDAITVPEPLDSATLTEYAHNIKTVIEFIQTFDCSLWASSLSHPDDASTGNMDNLPVLAQSYQIGALLYGQRILDTLAKEDSRRDDLVQDLIHVIGLLREDDALLKCILWPIFVAGLECQLPAQRDFLLDSLKRFWAVTSCLNVVNAARILQGYWQWQQQEGGQGCFASRWVFTIGRLGQDWLLI